MGHDQPPCMKPIPAVRRYGRAAVDETTARREQRISHQRISNRREMGPNLMASAGVNSHSDQCLIRTAMKDQQVRHGRLPDRSRGVHRTQRSVGDRADRPIYHPSFGGDSPGRQSQVLTNHVAPPKRFGQAPPNRRVAGTQDDTRRAGS